MSAVEAFCLIFPGHQKTLLNCLTKVNLDTQTEHLLATLDYGLKAGQKSGKLLEFISVSTYIDLDFFVIYVVYSAFLQN